jgi:hypothetical protein
MITPRERLARRLNYSRYRISAALAQLREDITIAECSDDFAYTGRNRERMRQMLADEVTLSGLLARMRLPACPQLEQMELFA